MKVTVDVRHLTVALFVAILAYGALARAGDPVEAGAPPSIAPPAAGAEQYKCISAKAAGARSNWANADLDKVDGWNPFFDKMTAEGWDPAEILYTHGGTSANPDAVIQAVCFRRIGR